MPQQGIALGLALSTVFDTDGPGGVAVVDNKFFQEDGIFFILQEDNFFLLQET